MQRRKIKNKESDGTLSFDGFRRMGGRNNQPKVSLSVGIVGGGGAQGDHDGGGGYHIVSAVELGGKK